jgi:hypothetical protein
MTAKGKQSWRLLLVGVLSVAVVASVAYGISAESHSQTKTAPHYGPLPAPAEHVQSSTPSQPVATAEPTEPLQNVGTITAANGQGTTITEQFEIGELNRAQPTPPPSAVLEACNLTPTATAANVVYAPGKVKLGYPEGSLPLNTRLNTEGTVQSIDVDHPVLSKTAFLIDGQWRCYSAEAEPLTVVLQPGQTASYSMWVLLPFLLSNETPTVSRAQEEALEFVPPGGYTEIHTSGAGAAHCGENDVLMLYARLPFSVPARGVGGVEACGAVAE